MSLFQGEHIQLLELPEFAPKKVFELRVDSKNASMNVLNSKVVAEIEKCFDSISACDGLIFTSGKDAFIAGADITEFLPLFSKPTAELSAWIAKTQSLFNKIEDAPFPKVCAISGVALGGGFEFALTADFRIAAKGSKIGLPETKLGICPGWGGTVRLPRLIGADLALEWMLTGNHNDADAAFKAGAIDGIVEFQNLIPAAKNTMKQALDGKLNWKKRQEQKKTPLRLLPTDFNMAFATNEAFAILEAPKKVLKLVQNGLSKSREEALKLEADCFAELSKTDQAVALIGNFLADQAIKRTAKKFKSNGRDVKQAAVLGAGIMGGGIAFTSASAKTPIFMRDISEAALQKGMAEAASILDKNIQRGKGTALQMADTLSRIKPTLKLEDVGAADFVVEAVTENEGLKVKVLQETEANLGSDAILVSNTSTISISKLAGNLKRPENFCGMHFFNPVPRMPLVEIIRHDKVSDKTLATTVGYALSMGKTPIVVRDCPGFLINRVLFAYFTIYQHLILEGYDITAVDKGITKFGWPMGPATLLDVVGVDTAHHAAAVMSAGFPDRMKVEEHYPITKMYKAGFFGQKNGRGFFIHTKDAKGRFNSVLATDLGELFGVKFDANLKAETAVERLMTAFVLESIRCLEEKIAETPHDLDMAMLLGIGFPAWRGGPLRYAESVGLGKILETADRLHAAYGAKSGTAYVAPELLKKLAKDGGKFYV